MITRRRNRMADGFHSFKDRVMGTVSSGSDSASGAVTAVKDRVSPDAVRQQTEGSPLGAGLVALGIGFITAAVFPATHAEETAAAVVKEKAEPITDELAAAGREVASDLKEHAAEAAEELKQSASQAASEVKSTASNEASGLSDDASRAREEVSRTRSD